MTQLDELLAGRGLDPRLTYDGSGTPVGTVSAVESVDDKKRGRGRD